MLNRRDRLDYSGESEFDVAIVGGGINGSCLYNQLCNSGFKVILMDKGDFGCGTSQASAMMVWGGLLYLRNLEFLKVYKFSRDRDFMIRELGDWVLPRQFRYIPNTREGRNRHLVRLGLYLYWLLGRFNRKRPASQNGFEESVLLSEDFKNRSLLYEEAFLNYSDARFLLHWITSQTMPENVAINYCQLSGVRYNARDKLWHLDIKDRLTKKELVAKSRLIINCAGVWTDAVNKLVNIETPCKHILSKGVFIAFKRSPKHELPMIFETGHKGAVLSLIPWGPVALWGPSEEVSKSITEGFCVGTDDIGSLLSHANRNLNNSYDKSDIVSMRCGIRPLAVKNSFNNDCASLDISRFYRIIKDPQVPWVSTYGGKITSCISMAEKICSLAYKYCSPTLSPSNVHEKAQEPTEWVSFGGLQEKVPSLEWCIRNEFCCTIEDYLRRRTNISQWVPREGLGTDNENLPLLRKLSFALSPDKDQADESLNKYIDQVTENFDRIIMGLS